MILLLLKWYAFTHHKEDHGMKLEFIMNEGGECEIGQTLNTSTVYTILTGHNDGNTAFNYRNWLSY